MIWPLNKIFKPKSEKPQSSRAIVLTGNSQGELTSTPGINYEKYYRETYMKSVIAYRCIDYRAKSFSSVPWHVHNSNEYINEKHPFNKILEYPNINEGWGFFAYKEIAYRIMTGNSFTYGIASGSKTEGSSIKEMHILRPDRMEHVIKGGEVVGYIYNKGKPDEARYERDPVTGDSEVMQVMLFNPLDDLWGMSPTTPGATEVDAGNAMDKWNLRMLQNEGRPGMIITIDGSLTEEQFDQLEGKLKSMYSGSANAGNSLILEGLKTEVKPYSWSPKEMDWLESNRETSRNICLAYGVPPLLINIPGDSTYNNYKEARLAFWEDTVVPDLVLYKSEINSWLFKNSTEYLNYDLSEVPAFSEKRKDLWERADKSTDLTINERRSLKGYGPIAGGDIILVQSTMIPLGSSQDDTSQNDDSDESKEINDLIEMGYTEKEARCLLGIGE